MNIISFNLKIEIGGTEESKVDEFIVDISKARALAGTRFSGTSITDTHCQRPRNCLFCVQRQNSCEHLEKMHLQGHRSSLQVQTFDP